MTTSSQLMGTVQDVPVLGHERECQRVISLYTLMYEVQIGDVVNALDRLAVYQWISESNSQEARISMQTLERLLEEIRGYAKTLDFDATLNHQIYQVQDTIDHDFPYGTLWRQIGILIGALHDGILQHLRNRKFLFMPPEEAKYYQSEILFGAGIDVTFPEASADMLEAGNAYAANLNTACVFHCMRVAEFALRRIAAKVQIELTENGKPLLVEFATWEKVLQGIENKRAEIRKKPKSEEQNRELLFYAGCGDTLSYLKDCYRNDVMHVRRQYNEHNALDAAQRVRSLLKTLAEGPRCESNT